VDSANVALFVQDPRLASVYKCAYTSQVSFQWDRQKAASNLDATVFDDPHALTMPDLHPDEERFVTLALDSLARVLVVSWTQRDDEIRLISARKATRRERRQYEEEK
jgi:uncharacterized protein